MGLVRGSIHSILVAMCGKVVVVVWVVWAGEGPSPLNEDPGKVWSSDQPTPSYLVLLSSRVQTRGIHACLKLFHCCSGDIVYEAPQSLCI